jgi:hypothetical protein
LSASAALDKNAICWIDGIKLKNPNVCLRQNRAAEEQPFLASGPRRDRGYIERFVTIIVGLDRRERRYPP